VDEKPDRNAALDVERGNRLKHLRKLRGLSQEALESASGVPQAQLSRYEQGSDMVTKTAEKIADALGVTVDELIGRAPVPGQLEAGGPVDPTVAFDPYPNRRRLRMQPEFREAAKLVQDIIIGTRCREGEPTLIEWVERFLNLERMYKSGELEAIILHGPPVPLRPPPAPIKNDQPAKRNRR
jgi:transcriptional regulator with XRE-family HTH domain